MPSVRRLVKVMSSAVTTKVDPMLRRQYTARTMSRTASPAQTPRMTVLGWGTNSSLMKMASRMTATRTGPWSTFAVDCRNSTRPRDMDVTGPTSRFPGADLRVTQAAKTGSADAFTVQRHIVYTQRDSLSRGIAK